MANLEISRAKRLDVYVQERLPGVSRAFAAEVIKNGQVLVNDGTVKSGYKIKHGDIIDINYVLPEITEHEFVDMPILYEDDDCIVINKPIGVLTHSKGAFNPEGTVASFIASSVSDSPDWKGQVITTNARTGIVHRLDRATSGVIICAKNPPAMVWLQRQFSSRKVKKTYYAVIEGELEMPEAIIDLPIERNPKAPAMFRVGANGKSAITQYKVMTTNGERSLIRLTPTTGRTHQLRVHLKHLGHPIIGDPFYNGAKNDRMLLHAESLEITLPNSERKVFTAPLPREFQVDEA